MAVYVDWDEKALARMFKSREMREIVWSRTQRLADVLETQFRIAANSGGEPYHRACANATGYLIGRRVNYAPDCVVGQVFTKDSGMSDNLAMHMAKYGINCAGQIEREQHIMARYAEPKR